MGSRRVHVSISADADMAKAEIRDTGSGIAAAIGDRIFEPFVTTKSRGSGLGLAICNGIAARHNGRLTAHSAEDGGAVFTLLLPLEGHSP